MIKGVILLTTNIVLTCTKYKVDKQCSNKYNNRIIRLSSLISSKLRQVFLIGKNTDWHCSESSVIWIAPIVPTSPWRRVMLLKKE